MANANGNGRYFEDKLEQLRQATAGREADTLARCGVPEQYLKRTADGQPCPVCGGEDRYNWYDRGGGFGCRKCKPTGGGDVVEFIKWLRHGDDPGRLADAMAEVAEAVGLDFDRDKLGRSQGSRSARKASPKSGPPAKKQPKKDPAKVLTWCGHETSLDGLLELFERGGYQPGVTAEALKACGVRLARIFGAGGAMCFALPIYGPQLDDAEPIGYAVASTNQRPLRKKARDDDGNLTDRYEPMRPWELTPGSSDGIVGDLATLRSAREVYKVEGVTDCLAALSLADRPEGLAIVTNACGAGTMPKKEVAEVLTGNGTRPCFVLHDNDEAGQKGAVGYEDSRGRHRPGWCDALASPDFPSHNVRLPGDVAADNGYDLRDAILKGEADWLQIKFNLEATAVGYRMETDQQLGSANRADDERYEPLDPDRLAEWNLATYRAKGRDLRYWQGNWYQWKRDAYYVVGAEDLKNKLRLGIKDRLAKDYEEDLAAWQESSSDSNGKPPTLKRTTINLVNEVLAATASMVGLDGDYKLETWIPTGERRNYLSAANGIIDLDAIESGEGETLLPHSGEWFSQVSLPYDYEPGADCPSWKAALRLSLQGDEERMAQLQEWAGYLLTADTSLQRFLIIEGEGANGKSAYCAGIEALLAKRNCSAVPFEDFSKTFDKELTLGKLVNICPDVGDIRDVSEGDLKAFVAGDTVKFEQKGRRAFNAKPTARLMLACNNRPKFRDRTSGLWRRILLVPFDYQLAKAEQIKGLTDAEYWDSERPGMLNWAIEGYLRLRKNGDFTESARGVEAIEDYQREVAAELAFFDEKISQLGKVEDYPSGRPPHGEYLKAAEVWADFRDWCQAFGYRSGTIQAFGRSLRRRFGDVKRRCKVDGKTQVIYVGLTWQDDRETEDEF